MSTSAVLLIQAGLGIVLGLLIAQLLRARHKRVWAVASIVGLVGVALPAMLWESPGVDARARIRVVLTMMRR